MCSWEASEILAVLELVSEMFGVKRAKSIQQQRILELIYEINRLEASVKAHLKLIQLLNVQIEKLKTILVRTEASGG